MDLHCAFSNVDIRKLLTHMKSAHGLVKKGAKYSAIQFGLQELVDTNTKDDRHGRAVGPLRTATSQSRFQPYVSSRSPSRSRADMMTQLPTGVFTPNRDHSTRTTPVITRPSSPIPDNDMLTTTGTSNLLSSNLLHRFSLRIHQIHKTLHCLTCLAALLPAHAKAHLTAHEIVITVAETIDLLRLCAENQVLTSTDDFESPSADKAPVEGLAIHNEGYSCSVCSYCSTTIGSFDNHWSANHSQNNAPARISYTIKSVQTFFLGRPRKYFSVLPSLASLPDHDLFALYLTQQVPKLHTIAPVNPPTDIREVPPLLQVMLWHEHLQDFITSKSKIRLLRTLIQLPTGKQSKTCLDRLGDLAFQYAKDIRTMNNGVSLAIKCLLMECPR